MNQPILETNKRPGVCSAVAADGLELPAIDVTHPAFAMTLDDAAIAGMLEAFVRE